MVGRVVEEASVREAALRGRMRGLQEEAAEMEDGWIDDIASELISTGEGDLYPERTRSDLSVEEWAQHVLRFYDGRALSSLRGHRAIWAIFNTFLRNAAQKRGNLLHKQSNARALTRLDLVRLYTGRQDLFQKLQSFGSDIPTTSMHWKRKGNELEWIARQMSWAAPWTSTGRDVARRAGISGIALLAE